MQMIDGVEYLDGDEAVALLGVKKATLYAYVSRGLLSSFRQAVGRRRLYRRDEVATLCEVRPSEAAPLTPTIDDDGVMRGVTLPDAASWAGEH